jgi:uncharacterized protein (DUF1697 family)
VAAVIVPRVPTFAALLRGINVGGKNKVPMAELKAALESLGLEDVVTYIQSGNVVFTSSKGSAGAVAADVERRIGQAFGVDAAVLLRTPAQLKKIAAGNPFLKKGVDRSKLHVVFLDGAPAKAKIAKLDPDRSPTDEFSVSGREVYLHLPEGAGRSKLTIDWFERGLGVRATARNWKTLEKLIELTER